MKRAGFTLMELLVSVLVISILTSLVIPDLRNIRRRAFDVTAQNFIRSVATKLEDHFFDNFQYFSCTNSECNRFLSPLVLPDDIQLTVQGDGTGYRITARHNKGTGKTFLFDSERGGFVAN